MFKHDKNKIIEKCASLLAKKFGFNPCQVLRSFQLFPMYFFENTPKVPEEDIENWYYLRDTGTHSALIFNYETEEYKLINEEQDWNNYFFEEMRLIDLELENNYKIYVKEMNLIKNSEIYKEIEPLLKIYLSLKISQRNKGTPIEYVQSLLLHPSVNIKEDQIEEITHNIVNAYHFEQDLLFS